MKSILKNYCDQLDKGVDTVRRLSKDLTDTLSLTGFAYVRVYPDGRTGWITSDADHDRLLIESGALTDDPLIDTAQLLKEGRYLWFHDREFPGSESFYRQRSKLFKLDHGLVIVNHCPEYLETGVFSGLLAKRPLYNFFFNKTELFRSFLKNFKLRLDKTLIPLLEEGIKIEDLKSAVDQIKISNTPEISLETKSILAHACGWSRLLKLSPREQECLVLLGEGLTYRQIGVRMHLSSRTIEHYFESIKNKLVVDTRSELHQAAQQVLALDT